MAGIVELANGKIAEDAPCFFFRLPRTEADERYGDLIYDRLKVPRPLPWPGLSPAFHAAAPSRRRPWTS